MLKGTIRNKKKYIESVYYELISQLSKIESMNVRDSKNLQSIKMKLKKNKKLPLFLIKPGTGVKTPNKERSGSSNFENSKTISRSKSPFRDQLHKFLLN